MRIEMNQRSDDEATAKRRPSRSVWAAILLGAGAGLAWAALEAVKALGGQLIIQEAAALLVFLIVTVGSVAWVDRRADSAAPTVGAEISVVATVIALGVLVLGGLRIAGAVSAPAPVGCINTSGPDHTTIAVQQAVTYKRPTVNSDATGLLILGCRLRFGGYCVGDNVKDQIGEIFDARWLRLSGGQGYLASAHTAGPPPSADAPRSDCPAPRRHPTIVSVAGILNPKRSTVRLRARARDTAIIGFVVKESDGWRRLGWDKAPDDDAATTLSVRPGTAPGLIVRAIPCVGYHQPFGHFRQIRVGRGPAGLAHDPFNPEQPKSHSSMEAACDLPTVRPAS